MTQKTIETMIDNTTYVKNLIRKQVEDTLTKEEYVEWKLAKLYYDEEEWFGLEVDVFCEVDDAQPEEEMVDWRPLFATAQERERQLKRSASRTARRSKWVIAATLLITIGWGIKHHWDVHYGPLPQYGECTDPAATRSYRNVPLKAFIRSEGARVGAKFGDVRCLPDSKRINAAMCNSATLEDFLVAIGKEGVRVYAEKGVYTFCDPATGKPWTRATVGSYALADEPCGTCRNDRKGLMAMNGLQLIWFNMLF